MSPKSSTNEGEDVDHGNDNQDDYSEEEYDEDDEDDDESEGRSDDHRKSRRFITERKNEKLELSGPLLEKINTKRPRLDSGGRHVHNHRVGRIDFKVRPPTGRRMRHNNSCNPNHNSHEQRQQCFVNNNNLRQIPLVSNQSMLAQSSKRDPPKGPVIYINPKFIKKFIEKSMKLSANCTSSKNTPSQMDNNSIPNDTSRQNTPSTSQITNSIEQIEFKSCPKKCLQAASTMAIIRLVTECIQDDSKRSESLNKILISRLIDNLC